MLDQPEIVKVFQCRTLIENSQLTVLFVSCVCLIQVFLLAAGARKNTARFNCKLHAYTLNCHLSRFPVIIKSSLALHSMYQKALWLFKYWWPFDAYDASVVKSDTICIWCCSCPWQGCFTKCVCFKGVVSSLYYSSWLRRVIPQEEWSIWMVEVIASCIFWHLKHKGSFNRLKTRFICFKFNDILQCKGKCWWFLEWSSNIFMIKIKYKC